MIFDMTYAEAIEKAKHLIAVGSTTIHLRSDVGFPYDKVSKVEEGGGWRLVGPSSCYLIVQESGLKFKLDVDFEERDANGRGVSLFNRPHLREVMRKLPTAARKAFADLLETKCLPKMAENTASLRDALNANADSEDCVRGLIAFAREPQP